MIIHLPRDGGTLTMRLNELTMTWQGIVHTPTMYAVVSARSHPELIFKVFALMHRRE